MSPLPLLPSIILIGCGATVVMDIWLLLLRSVGLPTLNFAMVGRWAGHLTLGTLAHAAIAKAAPVRGELPLGWLVHYLVGIAFAGILVLLAGPNWIASPSLGPALLLGLATVAAPLLIMQPAMGAGFLASKTAKPLASCARSSLNHAVFGCGLYVAAALLAAIVE